MFDLTAGELFVTGFILLAILTARFWPVLGEQVALILSGEGRNPRSP